MKALIQILSILNEVKTLKIILQISSAICNLHYCQNLNKNKTDKKQHLKSVELIKRLCIPKKASISVSEVNLGKSNELYALCFIVKN